MLRPRIARLMNWTAGWYSSHTQRLKLLWVTNFNVDTVGKVV